MSTLSSLWLLGWFVALTLATIVGAHIIETQGLSKLQRGCILVTLAFVMWVLLSWTTLRSH